jgi:hypothetical protein
MLRGNNRLCFIDIMGPVDAFGPVATTTTLQSKACRGKRACAQVAEGGGTEILHARQFQDEFGVFVMEVLLGLCAGQPCAATPPSVRQGRAHEPHLCHLTCWTRTGASKGGHTPKH